VGRGEEGKVAATYAFCVYRKKMGARMNKKAKISDAWTATSDQILQILRKKLAEGEGRSSLDDENELGPEGLLRSGRKGGWSRDWVALGNHLS